MASKLIVDQKCPYCKEYVEKLPDHILKKESSARNVEFVVTRTGRKQYFHTECFAKYVRWTKEHYADVEGE